MSKSDNSSKGSRGRCCQYQRRPRTPAAETRSPWLRPIGYRENYPEGALLRLEPALGVLASDSAGCAFHVSVLVSPVPGRVGP